MTFKLGDPVWALSQFGRGWKAAEIAAHPGPKINPRQYSILVYGLVPENGLPHFGAHEWQLFPRGEGVVAPELAT